MEVVEESSAVVVDDKVKGGNYELADTMPEIGQTARMIRNFREISLTDVCRKIRISTSCLSDLENSKRVPQLDTMGKLCDFYGVSLYQFFTMAENVKKFGSDKMLQLLTKPMPD